MSSDLRKAVITKLAKMEMNANLLAIRSSKFNHYKTLEEFEDLYGRSFYLHGEKDTWETLYADVLRKYRSQVFELEKLLPELGKSDDMKRTMEISIEIESKKKKRLLGGMKDDYGSKVGLLPKFVESHNMLNAYIKTSLHPTITDKELFDEIDEITKLITVKKTSTSVQPDVEKYDDSTGLVTASVQTAQKHDYVDEQIQSAKSKSTEEKSQYVLFVNRDVKLLDKILHEYDIHIARIGERTYDEIYNVQKILCEKLEASGIKGLEGGGEIIISNKTRLKDLEMLNKTNKVSDEQKLLITDNWESTKRWYEDNKSKLFDLLTARYQGA